MPITLIHDSDPLKACMIIRFLHCARCLEERPEDQSPAEWARLNIGMTKQGIQIWCERHHSSVDDIKFSDKPPEDPGLIVRG